MSLRSGKIPAAMPSMRLMSSLGLDRNRFSGRIPEAMASMTRLVFMQFYSNRLSGKIPDAMVSILALRSMRSVPGKPNQRKVSS